ncbi:MAG: hypothetical protein RBR53_02580 [Desulforegulaceae bacterium]|nr:hypothetical protein [Desulforegulaceae bacterium]
MRKIVFLILIYFSLVFNLSSENICENIDIPWLLNHAPFPENAEIISKKDVFGLCELIVLINTEPMSLYCGKDFFISGQMLKDKEVITLKTIETLADKINKRKKEFEEKEKSEENQRILFFKQNNDKLKEFTAFEFGAKNPDKTIFVITDPKCFHCKQLLIWLEKVSVEDKIKVNTILYPVMGDESKDMAARAVCNDFGISEYLGMEDDSKPYICEKSDSLFMSQEDFFKNADLNFIPYIVDSNFKWSVEGADLEVLKEKLKNCSN